MAPKATASVIIVYIDYLLKILLDFNWPFFFFKNETCTYSLRKEVRNSYSCTKSGYDKRVRADLRGTRGGLY